MRIRLIALLGVIGLTVMIDAQSRPPADIHPQSLSRVPPVQRADLDAEGQRIYDALAGAGKTLAPTGPSAVTMHSPKAAEPIYALNQYLRKTVAGSRYFEVAALVAAREFDQQYEWSAHEPAALRAGVEQSVIEKLRAISPLTPEHPDNDRYDVRALRERTRKQQAEAAPEDEPVLADNS